MSSSASVRGLERLRQRVVGCSLCPRLVRFREGVPKRASFRDQEYWRRPVPGFGDPDAWLLILGLAPAAHGGNRTGRVFTGDESARFLTRALYEAGFASQPTSTSREDGLVYRGCYLAAVVRCVPPGDRPTPQEFANCAPYLDEEIGLLPNLSAVIALGQMAFRAYLDHLRRSGVETRGAKFVHGEVYRFAEGPRLYASYHPSPRNTFTGKLTRRMFAKVFERAGRDQAAGLPATSRRSTRRRSGST